MPFQIILRFSNGLPSLLSGTGIFFFMCLFNNVACAQSEILPGFWKSHLSYKEGRHIAQSKTKVMYAAQRGLYTIDKEDLSVSFLSREQGLSDIDVTGLYYDSFNEQFFVTYVNNTFDILTEGGVLTVPDIAGNTTISGSKTIHDFSFSDPQTGYIATDFGILGYNGRDKEFRFTTFTQRKVFSVCEALEDIYAATEDGLFKIAKKDARIADFGSWTKVTQEMGLPFTDIPRKVRQKNNILFVWQGDEIYVKEPAGAFRKWFSPPSAEEEVNFLSVEGSYIMVGTEKNNQTRVYFIEKEGTVAGIRQEGCVNKAKNALEDEMGRVWYADEWEPLRYTEGLANGPCKQLKFPVPYTNDASQVRFRGEKAYVASGGVTEDYQYKFTRYGFYTYEKGNWQNYNQDNIPEILEQDFLNLFCLAPHPTTQEVYLGSYYNGLMLYNEETGMVQHWNKDNSLLQGVTGDPQRTRISGLAFDKDRNLWISNYGSPNPLVVRTAEGMWYRFSVQGSSQLADIAIDPSGNKWIVVPGVGNGILVYNQGSSIEDPKDDKVRFINRNNSLLTGNRVNSVVIDLDGAVWVGTDQGPVVFDCGDPFQDISCKGSTRPVLVDGIPSLLLRDEDILCMEVDGANRKWFGTRNGIFVQSPDGTEKIAQFNTENAPLLNNKIIDLAFNAITGDMMIVSSSGIQTYRTFTTGGQRTHGSNVTVFPNPVRPDYEGEIFIKGLVRDANVKITDVNGRLIYETKALGGQAIWNGRDYNGVKAATGVYLVFSANENTSQDIDAYVTKVLIVD